MKIMPNFDDDLIKSLDYDDAIVASVLDDTAVFCTKNDISVPVYTFDEGLGKYKTESGDILDVSPLVACGGIEESGGRFVIPLVVPEGVYTGDGRTFEKDSITSRNLPLPLMWQIKTGAGHDGAVVVGRIDAIEEIENGLGNARGVFDVGPYGREAERMVRNGFLRGVSGDFDRFEASIDAPDAEEEFSDKKRIKNEKVTIEAARLMGVTIVPKPAFQECFIMIETEPTLDTGDAPLADGIHEELVDDIENEIASIVASAVPVIPPREWFKDPQLTGPTPLKVMDDGRVFGHIASWSTTHIGRSSVRPPRSASKYAYFRTGELRTTEGDVQVGQLTLVGGHASLSASANEAIKHYDDTASAMADVVAGEDEFGIWVAGALRPDVTPSQVRAFRASAPSGDWRPINGRLELVAVCAVNVPGFPIARAITASGGVPGALVAAGASYLAELKEADKLSEIESRLNRLESSELSVQASEARSRMEALLSQRDAELSAKASELRQRMAPKVPASDAELSAKIELLRARFNG